MKKLTRKIVALTLSLVMCISFSNTTFAYADNENISSSAEASKVNWWKIGWIILSDYVEKLIDLDGQSEKDSSWAYLVSPSIEYNTGDMGPEVYFRPEVDNSVGSIRMHGHRIIFATVYKGNIIKNLIMDCQSYTKYRPNETTGGIFVSWRRKEELPTGA